MMMPMLKVIGRIKKALDWYFFSLMVSLILGERGCESGPMEGVGSLHGPQHANVSIGDASQGAEEEGLGKRGREAKANTRNDWASVSIDPRHPTAELGSSYACLRAQSSRRSCGRTGESQRCVPTSWPLGTGRP